MVKVLIVEDAPFIVESFQEIIEDEGWEVSGVARDGREAIDLYRTTGPDIVIMDILMPRMDGIAAIKKIIEMDPEARIVVVSALAKKDLDKESKAAGAKAFIKKPFNIEELTITMRDILEG